MPTLMAKRSGCDEAVRELRGVLKRYDGAGQAAEGAVSWQFERVGLLKVALREPEAAAAGRPCGAAPSARTGGGAGAEAGPAATAGGATTGGRCCCR